MQQRRLGATGLTVSGLEAGGTPDRHRPFLQRGHNGMLIAEAPKGVPRDSYVHGVKFNALRDAAGGWSGFDSRPAAVRNALAYSLERLGVETIDVYRPLRLGGRAARAG